MNFVGTIRKNHIKIYIEFLNNFSYISNESELLNLKYFLDKL